MLQKIFCLLLAAGVLFAACKKNNTETDPPTPPGNNDPYIPPKWDRKDIPLAGNFCDIQMMNRALAYACDSKGQFWRTTDSGNTWVRTHTLPIVEIINALWFVNSSTGFAITDNRVLKTTDSGVTWQLRSFIPNSRDVYFADTLNGFYSGTGGVYRTSNGGTTWTFSRNADFPKLCFISAQKGWFNGRDSRWYTTSDGGVNWSLVHSAASGPQSSAFMYGLHAWDAQHVAAGKINSLRITQNGAAPVTNITDTLNNGTVTAVHYTGPGKGFMITNKMLVSAFKLPDTLVRGQQILANGPLNEMSFVDSITGLICGDNGVMLRYRKP